MKDLAFSLFFYMKRYSTFNDLLMIDAPPEAVFVYITFYEKRNSTYNIGENI